MWNHAELIEKAIKQLEELADQYDTQYQTCLELRQDYEVAFARATLEAEDKTVERRKATAMLDAVEELYAYRAAEAAVDILKHRMINKRAQLSALQSIYKATQI